MKKFLVIVLGMFLILGLTTLSWAGAELKISDQTKATFGFKGQIWAQSLEDALTTDKGTDNKIDFSVRQLRLYGSGQIVPLIKFGFNLDWAAGAWDAKAATTTTTSVTDANMTLDFAPEVKVLVGLYRTPFRRMDLTDSYGAYLFPHSPGIAGGAYAGALGNFRNAGITLWGDAMGGKIKYGAGVFDGDLAPGGGYAPSDDSPFYSVRLAVSPLTPQKGYVYSGQYINKAKKPVLTVGAGYLAAKYRTGSSASTTYTTTETATGVHTTTSTTKAAGATTTAEPTYSAWTADLYTEIPLGGGALAAEAAYMVYDRDIADGETNGYYAQVAYLFGGLNLQPGFRYEKSERTGKSTEDFTSWTAGLNYYIKGHDAKIQLEYMNKEFEVAGTTTRTSEYSDITLALQFQF
jgi:hypothetical protein